MLAAGSVENFIKREMERHGMAALFLGKLCQLYGISASQTRLSAALRGDSPLPNQVGERVRDLVIEIADYINQSKTPLALVDAEQIKKILDDRRAFKKGAEYDEDQMRELLLESNRGATQ